MSLISRLRAKRAQPVDSDRQAAQTPPSPLLEFLLTPSAEAVRDESLANIEAAHHDRDYVFEVYGPALWALTALAKLGCEVDVYRPIGGDFFNIWLRPPHQSDDNENRPRPGWRIVDDEWQARWREFYAYVRGIRPLSHPPSALWTTADRADWEAEVAGR